MRAAVWRNLNHMRKRTKSIILLIAVGQLLIILGLLALPTVVQAIPGRYRCKAR